MVVTFFMLPNLVQANNETADNSFAKKILLQLESQIQQSLNSLDLPNQTIHQNAATMMVAPCPGGSGVIGGKVVGDFNYNGDDDQDAGIGGVEVFLYGCLADGSSNLVTSVTTDGFGEYFFSGLTDGDAYRLEFVPPSLLEYNDGRSGDAGGPSVQFITAPSCGANASFAHPMDFCQGNPDMAATCFVNGDPLGAGSEAAAIDALVSFNWDNENNSPSPNELANAGEVGSAYGLAFDRENKTLYISAFIKRFAGMGTLGIGGIYTLDASNLNNPTVSEFLDIESIGIDVGSIPENGPAGRNLPVTLEDPSNDAAAYDKVATEGIGAIQYHDGKLWLVNLFGKTLHSIVLDSDNDPSTAPTAADVETFTIPNPGCAGGEWRPFALKIFRNSVYVGGVCDASQSDGVSDLTAHVYKMDGGTFAEILSFGLDYTKGYAANATDCEDFAGWYPWLTNGELPTQCHANTTFVYPTPVLSDLEIDIDGSMILGFMDRMGHQLGNKNWPLTGTSPLMTSISGGDILRAHYDNGTYVLESNATAGTLTADYVGEVPGNAPTTGNFSGVGNGQGPGGGEFYFNDLFNFPVSSTNTPHAETAQGDLAFYPGAGRVATTSLDPLGTSLNIGGVNYMSNTTGETRFRGYRLFQTGNSSISTFSKANGLGALITMCDLGAPLEIGGYMWEDSNEDGIQDGCEPAFASINVTLLDDAGNELGTTTTDANGQYNFNENVLNSGTITANTTYHIIAGTGGQFDVSTMQLSGTYFVTNADVGGGQNPDKTDSDAVLAANNMPGNFAGYPAITITTGGEGFVDHSYDFGFSGTNVNPVAAIGGVAFNDANNNGLQDAGEGGIGGVTAILYDGDLNLITTVNTNPDGTYCFLSIVFGDYSIEFNANNAANGTNYMFVAGNVGNDDTIDSDPDETTGIVAPFNFDPANGNDKTRDVGLFSPNGDIGGNVFNDLNGDGIQDAGEDVITGVSVLLQDADNNNAVVGTAFTDGNGNYVFTNVPLGNYIITFDATTNLAGVTNFQGSPQDQGNDDNTDSDVNPTNGQTSVIAFDPVNGSLNNVDAGYFATATIGGFAWVDDNSDGILNNGEQGLENVTVTLFDENDNQIATTTTGTDGTYSFLNQLAGDYYVVFDSANTGNTDYLGSPQNVGTNDSVDSDADAITGQTSLFSFDPTEGDDNSISGGFYLPNGMIGGFVFNDINTDGVANTSETGIEGVTVTLLDADNGNAVITTTTTSSIGLYGFPNLEAGNYIVVFDETTNTAGISNFVGSPQNTGNGQNDSDPNPNTGQTDVIAFNPVNGNNNEVDAGFYQIATLSGIAFGDANSDGIMDDNEQGIPNVTVTLFDNNTGMPIGTTMTNSSGIYEFPNLPAGDYYVIFDTASTGNNDYEGSPQDQGNDDNLDSDADSITGQTAVFSFNPSVGVDNVSAGFILPFGSVGDFVFKDCNNNGIQDAGETGIPNVEVTLSNLDNSTTVSGLTNAMGFYMFMNVQAGNYTLTFAVPGVGLDYAQQDQGNDDTIDSDVNPGTGSTAPFVIGGGEFVTNIDAGFIDAAAPFIINIPDLTVECDEDITSDVKAVDNCDTDPDLSFVDASITGTCPMFIIREWTATDDCGNTVTNTQKITLDDTTAPTITFSNPLLTGVSDGGSVTLECDDADSIVESDAVYDDNCDPNPTTNFTEVVEEGECETDGYYSKRTLTWYAEDNCGNFTEVTITVFITDTTPPVVDLPSDLTVDCNSIPPVPVLTVTDNCDDDVQMDFEEVILGDTCEVYKIVRSWFFYDDCLNGAWAQQKIVVMVDNLVLEDGPDDITIECDEDKPPFPILTATNMCSPPTVDTTTLLLPYDEATCSQKCIRVWTATDECGHEETTTQLITIVDTTAPEIEFNHPALNGLSDGDSLTLTCDQPIPFGPDDVIATDNCNDVNINFMEMETIGDCEQDGYFIRLECCWKADDGCGNQSQICIIMRFIDEDKPILSDIPADITVNQAFEEVPAPADVMATDVCDNDVEIELVESQIANQDGCGYVLTRTWIATDNCGNSCSDSQVITVEDVCDCPNILVNGTNIQNAECGQTNGSITVDMNIDPSLYNYLLLPNFGTQSPAGNEFTNLPPGAYVLIISLPDFPDCDEKIYFNIEEEDCIDFLTATIQGEEEVCLTTNELDYEGVITSATIFQNGNTATVECTNIDGECVTLTPAPGYLGDSPDQIGVVHCYNNNPNQCDTTYLNVTVEPAPFVCNLSIDNENVTQPTCQGDLGRVEIAVSGMEGNLTYTWSPNVSSSNVANDLTGGDYAVTVTDAATDCTVETIISIENIDPATLTASDILTTNISCFGENNGSVISNTNTAYTISNADGTVGQTPMNNLTAGVYTISNTTANCSASLEIEITEPDELKVDFAATPESCLENDGTLSLTVTGGVGAMIYTWNPAVSTTANATGLTASQTYSVTVEDATGCQTILENLAVANDCQPCDLQLTVDTQNDETCMNANGEISLSAANQNGVVSYVWTPSVSTTNAAFGLSQGIYEIMATDEFGCTASASVTINRTMPTWSATADSTPTTCGNDNGTATLTVANDPGGLTYTWSPNVSTTNTAENLAAGTYTVTITDANGCQITIEVEVESTPVDWSVEAIAVNANCGATDGSIMITNTGTGTYTYAWQPNVSTTNQAMNLMAGLYQITVTDENGCEQIVTAEILQNDVQFTAVATVQNASCTNNDGTIAIDVTGTGVYTYAWQPDVSTTNEATELAAGLYQITVTDENGCLQVVSTEVVQDDVPFTATSTIQNASCAGNDGVITIDVTGTGNYTYTWSDNISTTNEATGLLPNTPYSVTVTDENGCLVELIDMAVAMDCDPSGPTTETIADTVMCGMNSIDLCINLSQLTGDLQGVTVCQQPTNGALSFVSDTCFAYSPMPAFAGVDTVCFVACDVNNVCDTTIFAITVEACNVPCEDFISIEEALVQTANCDGLGAVCLDVPFSEALTFGITDNGVEYTGNLEGCMNDTTFTYPSVIIPDGGNNGPYDFTWDLNNTSISGTFNSVAELVSIMNNNDPTGAWTLNPATLNIGGGNPAFTYGMIEVTQTATGGTANLEPSTDLLPNGTMIWLAVGTHQMIFTDAEACADTMIIEVFCIQPEIVEQNVLLNNDGTYCFDDAQVPGTPSALEVTCDNCDNLDYTIDDNCINYTGLNLGTADLLLVICDDNDLCDTVFLTVNVINSGLLPDANIDGDTTQLNEAVSIPVLENDEINGTFVSINITENPANGSVIVDGNNVVYSPNLEYCGFDAFTYEICNENGCDVATVNLLIECTEPEPMNGFSPNGDGVNDGFMIKNLDMFPENELLIFDRWGNRVFHDLNYEKGSLWTGEYRNLVVPDGTYFYMFKYGEGETKSGFVQIQR